MEFAKYIFIIVASITIFGIFIGLDPNISVAEMTFKAVITGLIFASVIALREAKNLLLSKI